MGKTRRVTFGIPGSLDRPTGGFRYDREILDGLSALGFEANVQDLGDDFPFPSGPTLNRLNNVSPEAGRPFVVDGLALGVIPDWAEKWADKAPLISLLHHPLCLEAGLSKEDQTRFRDSEQCALRYADHVVVTGNSTQAIVADLFSTPLHQISVVEPGLNVSTARNFSGGRIKFIAIGALIPRKRYSLMLKALQHLPPGTWTLDIFGETEASPEETRQVFDIVSSLSLSEAVTIHGAVDDLTLDRARARSHIFLSTSAYEGYGMALAEAVAAGLDPVATDAGAARELIPSGAGACVPVDDAAAFLNAVKAAHDEVRSGNWRPAPQPHRTWEQAAKEFAAVLDRLQ